MSSRVTFTKTDNGTLIRIGNSLNGRVKVLFLIRFLAYLGLSAGFFGVFLWGLGEKQLWLMLIVLGFAVIFFLAAYRFLVRTTEREEILVSPDMITISKISIRKKQTNSYTIADIPGLQHVPPTAYTDHPLKGESFDYMGFAARDKELQTVNDEGRISFFTNGRTVRFGKGIASWEAKEISRTIYELTRIRMKFDGMYDEEIPDEVVYGKGE